MRLLVVYKDQAEEARKLIAELAPEDVVLAVIGPGRTVRGKALLERLDEARGSEIAVVGVNRKLQRSLENDFGCKIVLAVASVRGAGAALRDWIVPATAVSPDILSPSVALAEAASAAPMLLLARAALRDADALATHRYPFVNQAATALRELANAGAVVPGGLDRFFTNYRVRFAPSGAISVTFHVYQNGSLVEGPCTTEWHLKAGDHTQRDAAARIYFCTKKVEGTSYVLVLYCGPHPGAGFSADVDL